MSSDPGRDLQFGNVQVARLHPPADPQQQLLPPLQRAAEPSDHSRVLEMEGQLERKARSTDHASRRGTCGSSVRMMGGRAGSGVRAPGTSRGIPAAPSPPMIPAAVPSARIRFAVSVRSS